MSSAVCVQNDGFLLYMFEEDLKTIHKWAAEYREQNNGDIPCYGDMYGLWTNSRNPVVHVVLKGNKNPADDYPFLQSPQFQNNTANSMFSYIGRWSFEKYTERFDQHMMNRISTKQPRVVFLEVKQKLDTASLPILFIKGQKNLGKIELLKGQNPFRLLDKPSYSPPDREIVSEEKKRVGATFLMDGNYSKESSSYASTNKQGNLESTSNVLEGEKYYHETPASSSTPPPQEFKDVSTCTKQNQWYLSEQGQKLLQEISSNLEKVLNEKPRISRDDVTHNIMILFSFGNKNYVVSFPPNFPKLNAQLYRLIYTTTNRSYATPFQVKSNDPIELVDEIINIISKYN